MVHNIQKTVWGDCLSDKPHQEYPRPQFVRDSYVNLNGWWDYAIVDGDIPPEEYQGKILVPFSPESVLSGVNRQLKPNQTLYYRTTFTLPKDFNKGCVFLHFGAVDSICDIYLNGVYVCHHEGGYNSFSVEITAALAREVNLLIVKVRDFSDTKYYTNGKQSLKRGGMWYTAQSGIWQTVWLESTPKHHVTSIKITPLYDDAAVKVHVECNFDGPVTVMIVDGEEEIAKADGKGELTLHFPQKQFVPWSPENPHLYNLYVITRRDFVKSYFGMRKFGVEKVGKYQRLMLNNKPYFHNGVLDQGYWSDGLYTAPSDEAMVNDIFTMKVLGFNMLRKHIKTEPLRWYYHCDRLGMLVWQDMPSGGTHQHKMSTLYLPNLGVRKMKDNDYKRFSREEETTRETFMREYVEMIDRLYNCVCIATWVPFNEGWGQFDASQVATFTKDYDPTRTVDHASGWHDQGGGDVNSFHVYFRAVNLPKDKKRALCLTEFGGYSYKDKEHCFNPNKTYAYKKFATKEQFNRGIEKLYKRDVIAKIPKGLCAAVYTQLSDVEDEVNGLLTFDRRITKVYPELMTELNALCVIKDE